MNDVNYFMEVTKILLSKHCWTTINATRFLGAHTELPESLPIPIAVVPLPASRTRPWLFHSPPDAGHICILAAFWLHCCSMTYLNCRRVKRVYGGAMGGGEGGGKPRPVWLHYHWRLENETFYWKMYYPRVVYNIYAGERFACVYVKARTYTRIYMLIYIYALQISRSNALCSLLCVHIYIYVEQ